MDIHMILGQGPFDFPSLPTDHNSEEISTPAGQSQADFIVNNT